MREPEEPLDGFPIFLMCSFSGNLAMQCRVWAGGNDLFPHPHSIAEGNASSRNGRDAFPRDYNPHKIQRIRSGHGNAFACSRKFAGCAQRFHRDRQRELFAQKSIDKPSASNLAAIFQPPESNLQFPPARQIGFSRQQIAEYRTITAEQRPAARLGATIAIRTIGVQQRPSPCCMPRRRTLPSPFPDELFGVASARKFSNPSAVTRPAATSSHKPVSTSALACRSHAPCPGRTALPLLQ